MDFQKVREQFPITQVKVKGKNSENNLIYYDHAASTHAPQPVLDIYFQVMKELYANVHRGEHYLSCMSTEIFEEVPQKIASFIGEKNLANSGSQVIMTSNTTSSLDLASHIFAHKKGDVLTTILEHHSNDLPHRRRGKVHHAKMLESGMLDLDDFEEKLQKNDIKVVAITAASNVTGYIPPVHQIARMAHDNDAKVIVDAAQRLAHYKIEVKPLDHPEHLDFLAGAGHKTYAPFGASFLFGNIEDFDAAPPYIPAGGTVAFVTEETADYLKGPERHTFGTPNITGSIAFGASLDFISEIGMDKIRRHELEILKYMMKGIRDFENLELYGDIPLNQKLGVIPFNVTNKKHDIVAHELDKMGGIATRNGCFCAHPYVTALLHIPDDERKRLISLIQQGKEPELPGAVRASLGIYNTIEEADVFIDTLRKITN